MQKYRKGIIVGSAWRRATVPAPWWTAKRHELKAHRAFYDYLEIQPSATRVHAARGHGEDEAAARPNTARSLLGEDWHSVVATGVHFLDPKTRVPRDHQAAYGFKDADNQPPLYFKTTQEMLDEFAYLGREKAEEVVIDNPAKIAARIGEVGLYPKHPEGKETFQPFWPDAADNIRNLCEEKIREHFGETRRRLSSSARRRSSAPSWATATVRCTTSPRSW